MTFGCDALRLTSIRLPRGGELWAMDGFGQHVQFVPHPYRRWREDTTFFRCDELLKAGAWPLALCPALLGRWFQLAASCQQGSIPWPESRGTR